MSEFQGRNIIVTRKILDKPDKKVLLLDTISAQKKLVTALKKTLAAVCTLVKDLVFSLI